MGSGAILIVLAVAGALWAAEAFDDVDRSIGIYENEQYPPPDGTDRIPVTGASTCDELVADPLFDQQAEVAMAFARSPGSAPDRCSLAVEPNGPVLDVLGVDTTCPAGASVLVSVERDRSGAWLVDREQTRQLGVDGCLWGR
jgi:hypothetical protein